nr:HlyD family efflux transporter periplasmic adaptor subunit [Tatlockia sp.]
LIHMEIQTAVLSKPIEPIISNNTGILSRIYVREGMKVKAGQPLFRLNDEKIARSISQDDISNINALTRNKIKSIDELNQKIQLSQLELAEAKVTLQNTMALKQQEIDKLQPSKAISQSQLVLARAKINSFNIQYITAKNNLNRFVELSQAGAVSQQRADLAKSELAKVDGALQEAKADLKIAETAVKSIQNGNFYDGNSFISNLPRLTVEVKDMQQRIQLAAQKVAFLEQSREKQQAEVKNLEKQKQQIIGELNQGLGNSLEQSPSSVVYKSPVSGSVLKVAKSPGNKVNDSETIVLLQPELGQPIVEAYLTQDQVTKVSIGSKVTVLIPDLDKSYQAQVVNIDRTGGLPDAVRGQYQLQGSGDKSAYVKLVVQGISSEERSKLTAGTPVRLQIIKSLNGFEGLRFLN